MTTSLTFSAPIDLSVGKVTISNERGPLDEWMATPDNRVFSNDVEPGFYSAKISPAGVDPQSVVFEVHAGQHNEVAAPSFSSLIASSGNMTFLDSSNISRAIEALYGKLEPSDPSPLVAATGLLGADDGDGRSTMTLVSTTNAEAPPLARRLGIGLSVESGGAGDLLQPFAGCAAIELSEVRLELVVSGPEHWSPYSGERVHLSVTIEGLRTEQLLLPMYRGGTQIMVTPSLMSSNDVELEVLPHDPRLRALARALIAGTPADAKAVQPLVRKPADFMSADAIDPWEAILSALLSIRFPDDLAGLNVELADALAALAPWAHDAHVILARQHLSAATDEATRRKAAIDALAQLTEALTCGWPYFDYANQLFAELIGVLQEYFGKEEGADAKQEEAAAVRHRWQQDQPLQSKAGASFSWRGLKPVASDGSSPNEQGPGGMRGATLLFAGQVYGGSIRLDPAQSGQPAKESSAQAAPSSIDFATCRKNALH